MSEALQISPLDDVPPAVRGDAGRGACREPGALHQSRDFLARVQPARSGGIGEPQPSAAGAAALPVDLGQEPRRILHGPRRRPRGPGARADRHGERRRTVAGRAAEGHRRQGQRAGSAAARQLEDAARRAGERRHRDRRAGHAERGRAHVARKPFPRFDLPGADPARDRPGAPVSLHPQSRLHARLAAFRQEGPRDAGARPRPDQRRAVHPDPADGQRLDRAALRHAGGRGRALHPAALPRLRGEREGRVPADPRLRTSKWRKRRRISSASSSGR